MSEFTIMSDAELSATLAAIESVPAAANMASAIRAEQAYRIENAAELAARAELVVICRSASETLAKIRHSTVAAISDPDGTIVKNARLALIKLLTKTFDGVNVARAEKIVMVLMDESGQTDAAGDVEKAAAYVAAHKTSTVYSTTRPDDADKGNHAGADTLNAAVSAGEKASDESKASK